MSSRCTLHYITLHYITLHCIALHYIALHCITLHYITLHFGAFVRFFSHIHIFSRLYNLPPRQAFWSSRRPDSLAMTMRLRLAVLRAAGAPLVLSLSTFELNVLSYIGSQIEATEAYSHNLWFVSQGSINALIFFFTRGVRVELEFACKVQDS